MERGLDPPQGSGFPGSLFEKYKQAGAATKGFPPVAGEAPTGPRTRPWGQRSPPLPAVLWALSAASSGSLGGTGPGGPPPQHGPSLLSSPPRPAPAPTEAPAARPGRSSGGRKGQGKGRARYRCRHRAETIAMGRGLVALLGLCSPLGKP